MRPSNQRPPAAAGLDLTAFLGRHGRLPRIGDEQPPWRYCGWLLPYIILHNEVNPKVVDRWGYFLRTLEAGKLLAEPIPQITFGPPDNQVFTLLHDWSRLIGWDCGDWSDFRMLLDWLCWALALSNEEPRFSEEVNENLYRLVNVRPLLETPHDYLGAYVSMGKARGWNPTAFYPTPHPVVECMVCMMFGDAVQEGRDSRLLSVNDPCVGSGRMLLHASNFSLNLYGQDIDPLAVAMCKINGALYVPWMSFPLPPSIINTQGDSPCTLPPNFERPSEAQPTLRVHDGRQRLLFEP
jgi:hypothetical protein